MRKIIVSFAALALLATVSGGVVFASHNPLDGKIIALDAGHGGTKWGAQYPANNGASAKILEKDVNLAVAYTLKLKLQADGARVVLTRKCDEELSNKQRADIATAECKSLYGRKCDVLLSVHHNGNTDATHDGTLVIYNGKTDKKFATYMHDALVPLTGIDEGYLSGGYGITIFGNFVSALTEAYYITKTAEANANLAGTPTLVCDSNGDSVNDYSVLIGDRTQQEVNALYNGLVNYFF